MLFNIRGLLLIRVTDLSLKLKEKPERLVRLALDEGLRRLGTMDHPSVVAPRKKGKQRPSIEEISAYVRTHWACETDSELARHLRCPRTYVVAIRHRLGLLRKSGRPNAGAPCAPPRLSLEQLGLLDETIRKHWRNKSDAEIGNLLKPKVHAGYVQARRYALGLKGSPGGIHKSLEGRVPIRELINPEELETMVCSEGFTMSDYLRIKGLPCSRQRLQQVAGELGLKHTVADRSADWTTKRRARMAGISNHV